MKSMKVGSSEVSEFSRPYIIAEIGVNHENSLQTAVRLIDEAREGGAHAAKFQTYKADLIAMKESPAYWDQSQEPANSQHELFMRYDSFGPEDYKVLAQHCQAVGIDFMSTPFDLAAVDALDPLVDVFKIASADVTNIPLLRRVGAAQKPVILSTGASYAHEIDRGIQELHAAGASTVILLQCILNYPTDESNANLGMISHLTQRYPHHVVGLSDHTRPTEDNLAAVVAYSLGARVIEKHFTHDKTLPGNDHYHAMDKHDLRRMVTSLDRVRALLGQSREKAPLASEEPARRFARRGICAASDLGTGHVVTESDLICLRPVAGIPAEHWDEVIGRSLTRDIPPGAAIQWGDLSAEVD